jgi:hypothetical protein
VSLSETVAVLIFQVLCGAIGFAINQAKHRSGSEGFLIGFFFSIVGIVIVMGRPKLPAREMPRVAVPL